MLRIKRDPYNKADTIKVMKRPIGIWMRTAEFMTTTINLENFRISQLRCFRMVLSGLAYVDQSTQASGLSYVGCITSDMPKIVNTG